MTAALTLPASAALATADELLAADVRAGEAARGKATAKRTEDAYRGAWEAFCAWASERAVCPLPASPEALVAYVGHLGERGLAPASIDLALAAISKAHKRAGHPNPRRSEPVREARAGVRRDRGTAQRQAAELTPTQLRAMVEALPDDLHGCRDRALLLLGFATALRRSELVALDVTDVRFVDGGLDVFVRKSKTDQEGKGRNIDVHRGGREETCPVRALRVWLEAAGIVEGPLFRGFAGKGGASLGGRLGDRDVARVLKRAAERVGLDASALAGHSLRSGAATAAIRAGALRADVCEAFGWKATGRSVDRYIRSAKRFSRNVLAGVL